MLLSSLSRPFWRLSLRRLASTCFSTRTHTCGALDVAHVGRHVRLGGWIKRLRFNGKFVVLGDAHGQVQVVVDDDKMASQLDEAGMEAVVEMEGTVALRPTNQVLHPFVKVNPKMSTGSVELRLSRLLSVHPVSVLLAFHPSDDYNVAKELLQLEHRHLALRTQRLQHRLRLRHQIVQQCRSFLNENDFVEVETPALGNRTPTGAREFPVMTHQRAGHAYALTQSPQQYKQILMAGGIDRYYQIAKCFRDEGGKPDRQPEFTQIDVEMSFVEQEGIMSLIEELIRRSWPFDQCCLHFPRLTFAESMRRFGIDKPDLRHNHEIIDITSVFREEDLLSDHIHSKQHVVKGIFIPCGKDKLPKASSMKELETSSKTDDLLISNVIMADTELKSSLLKKCGSECRKNVLKIVQDLTKNESKAVAGFIVSGSESSCLRALGQLRRSLASMVLDFKDDHFSFIWITDFPLFELSSTNNTLSSSHHPFTAPHPEDLALLKDDPIAVRGQHYDLVLNGQEIGGGSIRINDRFLQERILFDILKESRKSTHFDALLNALAQGCPPHGGIALGLDRYIAILTGAKSIRDVMAFPKSSEGVDLLTKAPSPLSEDDCKYYHINFNKDSKH